MAAPEYLICLNCETPCYTFEWVDGDVTEAICLVCGCDEIDQFIGDEEFDAMISER